MTRFINRITGGEMWVADDRAGEYIAAGHRLAAPLETEKPAAVTRMSRLIEESKTAEKNSNGKKPRRTKK